MLSDDRAHDVVDDLDARGISESGGGRNSGIPGNDVGKTRSACSESRPVVGLAASAVKMT